MRRKKSTTPLIRWFRKGQDWSELWIIVTLIAILILAYIVYKLKTAADADVSVWSWSAWR